MKRHRLRLLTGRWAVSKYKEQGRIQGGENEIVVEVARTPPSMPYPRSGAGRGNAPAPHPSGVPIDVDHRVESVASRLDPGRLAEDSNAAVYRFTKEAWSNLIPKEYAPSRTLLACLVPVAVVAIGIGLLGVNIPYVDQFGFIALLARMRTNVLTLSDLFAQNNENRPFFPRLIWLGLAGLSHYDIRLELWANLAIALGTFAFFAIHAIRTWTQFDVSAPSMLLPLMSFLVFNLAQWESWLQGFQTVMFLGSACVVVGFFVLTGKPTWRSFGWAVFAGGVGAFSTPNALLYWPIGLVVLLVTVPSNLRLIRSVLWTACGAACVFLFMAGWKGTPGYSPGAIGTDVLSRAYWVTNFLGAPLMTVPDLAFPFGVLSVGVCLLTIGHLARTRNWKPLVSYFAIAAFVVASGFLVSMGRMRLGIVQAVAPRYLTISVWYWVSLLTLVPLIPLRGVPQRVFYSLICVCLLWHTVWGALCANAFHLRMLPAYETAVSGGFMSDEVLEGVVRPGTYDEARRYLQYLADNKLSAYAVTP